MAGGPERELFGLMIGGKSYDEWMAFTPVFIPLDREQKKLIFAALVRHGDRLDPNGRPIPYFDRAVAAFDGGKPAKWAIRALCEADVVGQVVALPKVTQAFPRDLREALERKLAKILLANFDTYATWALLNDHIHEFCRAAKRPGSEKTPSMPSTPRAVGSAHDAPPPARQVLLNVDENSESDDDEEEEGVRRSLSRKESRAEKEREAKKQKEKENKVAAAAAAAASVDEATQEGSGQWDSREGSPEESVSTQHGGKAGKGRKKGKGRKGRK